LEIASEAKELILQVPGAPAILASGRGSMMDSRLVGSGKLG